MNPRKSLAAAAITAALALALSACSGSTGSLPGESSGSSSGADTTLTLGLSSDISTPDPSSAYSGSEMNLVLAAYGSSTGDPNYNPDADLDNDGSIDLTDFTLFANFYSVPCP